MDPQQFKGYMMHIEDDVLLMDDWVRTLDHLVHLKEKDPMCRESDEEGEVKSKCRMVTLTSSRYCRTKHACESRRLDYPHINRADVLTPTNCLFASAFDREFWNDMKRESGYFCRHDDYNWDLTMLSLWMSRFDHFTAVHPAVSRVQHVGTCGLHEFNSHTCVPQVCAFPKPLAATQAMIVTPRTDDVVPRTTWDQARTSPANSGGWGDSRDVSLCNSWIPHSSSDLPAQTRPSRRRHYQIPAHQQRHTHSDASLPSPTRWKEDSQPDSQSHLGLGGLEHAASSAIDKVKSWRQSEVDTVKSWIDR